MPGSLLERTAPPGGCTRAGTPLRLIWGKIPGMREDPRDRVLDRLRRICLALPDATERPSHGEPTWFVGGKKTFAMLDDHHHGAEHLSVWCAAPEGAQETLIALSPEIYFRPPYVGHRGWIGIVLDGKVDWDEVAERIEESYRTVAPKRLVSALDSRI